MRRLATFPRVLTRFRGEFNRAGRRRCPNLPGGWRGRHLPAEEEAAGASRHLGLGDLAPPPAPPRVHPIRAGFHVPRWLGRRSPPDGTESSSRCPWAAGRRGGSPGRSALATREPGPRHKAAAAQVSAAEPREPVNTGD